MPFALDRLVGIDYVAVSNQLLSIFGPLSARVYHSLGNHPLAQLLFSIFME